MKCAKRPFFWAVGLCSALQRPSRWRFGTVIPSDRDADGAWCYISDTAEGLLTTDDERRHKTLRSKVDLPLAKDQPSRHGCYHQSRVTTQLQALKRKRLQLIHEPNNAGLNRNYNKLLDKLKQRFESLRF